MNKTAARSNSMSSDAEEHESYGEIAYTIAHNGYQKKKKDEAFAL